MAAAFEITLAFVIVFVAEFADKTQLALVAMAARGRAVRVWFGAATAFLGLTVAAALLGSLIQDVVPARYVAIVAGLLFVGFGAWTLWPRDDGEEGVGLGRAQTGRSAYWSAFVLILVAELGDKTQLAVIALAANAGAAWSTMIGATAALWASSGLAVAVGGWMGQHVPQRIIARVSGLMFLVVGAAVIAFGARP